MPMFGWFYRRKRAFTDDQLSCALFVNDPLLLLKTFELSDTQYMATWQTWHVNTTVFHKAYQFIFADKCH